MHSFRPVPQAFVSAHDQHQTTPSVAVAPLVVVPADQFEEVAVQLDTRARIENARTRVGNEVARNNLFVGIPENSFEGPFARRLHRGADLLVARRLFSTNG